MFWLLFSLLMTIARGQAIVSSGGINGGSFESKNGPPVISSNPSMQLTKTPSPTTFSAAGQTITYTYVVLNNGNVSLNTPSINDNLTGMIAACGSGILMPGNTTSCTSTHVTTSGDISTGSVTNVASASVVFGGNTVTSNIVTVVVNCTGCATNTLSVLAPGHGLTPAVCDGTTDDATNIQAILTYAGNNATTAVPYTVTIPQGLTCVVFATNRISDVAQAGYCQNLYVPANVTLKGLGTGATISSTTTAACPSGFRVQAIAFGNQFPGLMNNNGTHMVPIQDTVKGANYIDVVNLADLANYHVGDLAIVHQQNPNPGFCVGFCDVDPEFIGIITAVGGSGTPNRIFFGTDVIAYVFAFGQFNDAEMPPKPNQPNISNLTGVTVGSPPYGPVPITPMNMGIDHLTVNTSGIPIHNQGTYGSSITNCKFFSSSANQSWDWNAVEHGTFINDTWDSAVNSTFTEGPQRSSHYNLFQNVTFGNPNNYSYFWVYGEAEFPHKNTYDTDKFYMIEACGFEPTGADLVIKNTIIDSPAGLCNAPPGGIGVVVGQNNPIVSYFYHDTYDNNTITCTNSANGQCMYLGVNSPGDTVTNNHFKVLTGQSSNPVIQMANSDAIVTGNTITWLGTATGSGIFIPNGGTNTQVNNNTFTGPSGLSINVTVAIGSTNCSVSNNTHTGGTGYNINAPSCTVTNNQ